MKKITALILAVLTVFCFAACKKAPEKEEITDTYLDEVIDRGVLKVGIVATNEPPLAFVNENYNIIGFDMDLANIIVDYLEKNYGEGSELKIQFNPVSEAKISEALSDGTADIMLDGCVYGQNAEVIYANGYIKDRVVAVADKEYVSAGELRGLKVAVMGGEDITSALSEEGVENMTTYSTDKEIFAALEDKSADVAVMSELAYRYYMTTSENEELVASDIGLENKIYAPAVNKEAKSIVSAVNAALEANKDEIDALADKWFDNRDCLNLQEN